MNFVLSATTALYLATLFIGAYSKPTARVASSVCFVADRIQIHNTATSWWWAPKLSRPVVTQRPHGGSHFNQEWMVFNVVMTSQSGKLLEIAHKLPGTRRTCRFLLHSQQGRFKMSRPGPCRPGQFGQQSLFSYGFEHLTNRQWIAVAGPRHSSQESKRFLGIQGRSLRTTSIRDRHMQFWDIKISNRKTCF